MNKDWEEQFDASIGLTFSLKAFEAYRKSGTLSAEIRSIPGVRGRCQAYLELTLGKVISCQLVDQRGKHHQISKELLMQLDDERGPYGWVFHPAEDATSTTPMPAQPSEPVVRIIPRLPVPARLVQQLDSGLMQQWTPQQQRYLRIIFSLVNGQRSVDEIKTLVVFPAVVVDEGIYTLILLKAIVIK